METYRYTKIVKAKPMTRHEAEMALGKEITNLFHGDSGFLIEYIDTKRQKWIPETLFAPYAKQYTSSEDKLCFLLNEMEYAKTWINEIKSEFALLNNVRRQADITVRHIEAAIAGINKILNKS